MALARLQQKAGEKLGMKSASTKIDEELTRKMLHIKSMEAQLNRLRQHLVKFTDQGTGTHVNTSFQQVFRRQGDRVSHYQEIGHDLKCIAEAFGFADKEVEVPEKIGICIKLIGQAENQMSFVLVRDFFSVIEDILERDIAKVRHDYAGLETPRLEVEIARNKLTTFEEKSEKTKDSRADDDKQKNFQLEQLQQAVRDRESTFGYMTDAVHNNVAMLYGKLTNSDQMYYNVVKAMISYHENSLQYLRDVLVMLYARKNITNDN